jgi:type IV pilus assembly protein PilW
VIASSTPLPSVRRSAGFSLIELLVGIAISLIGILVMFRMVSLWDLHSRTTTSGGDAQVTGTLAIFALERDLKPAGMGFGSAGLPSMNCNVQANDQIGPRAFNFPLVPVVITVGAAGAPDQIDILYGNSSFYVSEEPLQGSTATTKTMRRRGGFRPGDLAVVAGNPGGLPGSATCALIEITGDLNPDNRTLDHTTGNYANFYTGAMQPARFNTAAGAGAGFLSGMMYSLGPNPQLRRWQIAGGKTLTESDVIHSPATSLDVAENVINLKAQYGVDADNNGMITDAPNEWTTVPPADWRQVLAIRVAVLVRSQQFERSADGDPNAPVGVTQTAPVWSGGPFAMTNVDGTGDGFSGAPNTSDPNNWRFYRYRVFEKVIPLRNMIWGTGP